MLAKLKLKILESGRDGRQLSNLLGIHPSQLSHIVRGRRVASPELRRRIARLLRAPQRELFSENKQVKSGT
jgi:transcriptional regulator with XRE-family HTH domain